jgi:hypothetical protein
VPQKITNFSYVSVSTLPAPEKPAVKPIDKKAPPVPPVKLRPDQVRRTIALVVDDLGLSFEDMVFTRDSLKKFVNEMIYNAKLEGVSRQPKLQMQMRMFREGKLIYNKEDLLEVGQQKDPQRPLVGGRLLLGSQMEPSEYVLQVVVVDKLAKEKYNMATQGIDFDVVE